MPNLTFVLPHWLYWLMLAAVPFATMWFLHKQRGESTSGGTSLFIAYLLWLTGGFIGLHRFYLKSLLGVVYIPLFIGVLLCNVESRDIRDETSKANNELMSAEFLREQTEKQIIAEQPGAREQLAQVEQSLAQARLTAEQAQAHADEWLTYVRILAGIIVILMVIDAILMPGMYRRCLEKEARQPQTKPIIAIPVDAVGDEVYPEQVPGHTANRFHGFINRINEFTGNFVAYWSIIAVFVYYYEVLARYVFNSPTNWAHEAMILMFGMQYMLAGGYVLRTNGHVRVDVFYMHFSPRTKAVSDIITSVFFFIFVIALLWTSWTFFMDAYQVREVSFSDWGVQYWPTKLAMVVGAALLLLQGLSWLLKDISLVTSREA